MKVSAKSEERNFSCKLKISSSVKFHTATSGALRVRVTQTDEDVTSLPSRRRRHAVRRRRRPPSIDHRATAAPAGDGPIRLPSRYAQHRSFAAAAAATRSDRVPCSAVVKLGYRLNGARAVGFSPHSLVSDLLLGRVDRVVSVWNNLENNVINFSNIKCFKRSLLCCNLSRYTHF